MAHIMHYAGDLDGTELEGRLFVGLKSDKNAGVYYLGYISSSILKIAHLGDSNEPIKLGPVPPVLKSCTYTLQAQSEFAILPSVTAGPPTSIWFSTPVCDFSGKQASLVQWIHFAGSGREHP